ncbi:hypothetical protein JEQ12_014984 [Ovis aries]|uniref:Homeobox domain-containing protein n=1 Tax=Ovis aries TaxID=9940 RepID=A0A836D5U6_SHEEP|nr:hypothetical protein JEQ12_014984 [Ovis aries]
MHPLKSPGRDILRNGKFSIIREFECVSTPISSLDSHKQGQSDYLISESQGQHLVQKTQRKVPIMDLCQQGLEMGDNFTKSESWNHERYQIFICVSSSTYTNFDAQKQPAMPCDQNHLEVERKTKRKREGGGEKEEVMEENLEKEQDEEDKKEKKNKKRYQKKNFVSRPLMDTLWAMFKFKNIPTFQDISSLAFEFGMMQTQINQWFYKKRKTYKKEIHWREYKNRRAPDTSEMLHSIRLVNEVMDFPKQSTC